ncbi:MAG: putative cobaltochelatase [Actinomycetota bacterium]
MSGYPFSAVVGLDDLRLALLLNAVAPGIGGVLVRGEKGTAKSTVVRAMAALLPEVCVVVGCRFACDPESADPQCPDGPHLGEVAKSSRAARLVELPVGATEDRVIGSLDLERALTAGVKAFEPGLLASAHRGVLYVDEVNLLHDHLVDLLLDAAAMGRAHVEREGISVSHAAQLLLVGTMNPEEGELRPQLLDRFGLTVEVSASRDPKVRVEVVRRRLEFEADPQLFAKRWASSEADLARRIRDARARIGSVVMPDKALVQIAEICASFDVDGMRADLVMARTAIAHAAWHGREEVNSEDVRQSALLALPHRKRRNPFDAPGLSEEALDEVLNNHAPSDDDPEPPSGGSPSPGTDSPSSEPESDSSQPESSQPQSGQQDQPPTAANQGGRQEPTVESPDAPFKTRLLTVPGLGTGAAGRRSAAVTSSGRVTGARRQGAALGKRLHLPATLMAAAPHQIVRGRNGSGLIIKFDDVRLAVREGREGNLVLFVVDASGSMAARARMRNVKAAVLSLLLDAYQRRDKVSLITFRGSSAEIILPPTSSVEAGAARLTSLPTGGRTPIAAGLLLAHDVLRRERLKDPQRRALLVIVTDGKATGGAQPLVEAYKAASLLATTQVASIVIDCEEGVVRLGLADALATTLGATTLQLGELGAEQLVSIVHASRNGRAA